MPDGEDPLPAAERPDPLDWPGYADARERAVERTGVDESVLVRSGHLRGTTLRVVVVVWERL